MENYTFTFENKAEGKFREIISRLDDDEYQIIQDVRLVDENNPRYSDKEAIIRMDPQACLTFRLGMKPLKIRRERTEEELAEEEALRKTNTVEIKVYVDDKQ